MASHEHTATFSAERTCTTAPIRIFLNEDLGARVKYFKTRLQMSLRGRAKIKQRKQIEETYINLLLIHLL
jgi:hypothetical protein